LTISPRNFIIIRTSLGSAAPLGAVATDNRVKPESDVCVKVTEIQQFITIKKR